MYGQLEVISQASEVFDSRIKDQQYFYDVIYKSVNKARKEQKLYLDNIMYFVVQYDDYICLITPDNDVLAIYTPEEYVSFMNYGREIDDIERIQ